MSNNIPRGFRNHNPLNIRRTNPPTQWEGLASTQTDKSFVQFVSNSYGYRAAFCTLRTYVKKHKCDTVRKIIGRWAPPNENNTKIYIRKVSKISNVNPDEVIDLGNVVTMTAIVAAMAIIENGVYEIDVSEIKEGYRLAFGSSK